MDEKTSHGNTNSDKMITHQRDSKISDKMLNITHKNDIENQSRITNICDDQTLTKRQENITAKMIIHYNLDDKT